MYEKESDVGDEWVKMKPYIAVKRSRKHSDNLFLLVYSHVGSSSYKSQEKDVEVLCQAKESQEPGKNIYRWQRSRQR